jgi:hypothetical protein
VRIFTTNPNEPALLAVGQEAVGIFAFGQVALGVVAVGQMARGVFVVGQLAIGVVGLGQGVACLGWGGGMVGVAGRGFGVVLRVLPKLRRGSGRPVGLPAEMTMQQLSRAPAGTRGTVFGALQNGVVHADTTAVAALDSLPQVVETLRAAPPDGQLAMVVEVGQREIESAEVDYRAAPAMQRTFTIVQAVPWTPWRWPFEAMSGTGPASLGELLLRGLGMTALCLAWWFIAGSEMIDAVAAALE